MTNYPYILFNQSPEDLRRIGARGGRAYGRNRRDLRAQMPRPLPAVARPVVELETTAEAIAALDARFAWLRGAEKGGNGPWVKRPRHESEARVMAFGR